MNITSAQYQDPDGNGRNDTIKATIDGVEMHVPLDPANRHYTEIYASGGSWRTNHRGC